MTYGAYILALIPFLEIIRNELLANLVAVKETSYHTIDDLLNPKTFIFMNGDFDYLREENRKLDHDSELREKLEKLLDKIGKRSSASDILKLVSNPDQLKKIGRNIVLIDDEYSMRWLEVSKFCNK